MSVIDFGAMSSQEAKIADALLTSATYAQIAEANGCSRGRVYAVALRHGLRKYERRIQQRKKDREREQFEVFKEMMGSTVSADVLDFLALIPDQSVQTFVTSPPYNVSRKYSSGPSADCMPHLFYLGWQVQIISEIARCLKPGGTVVYQIGLTIDETSGERFPLDELLSPFFRKAGLVYQNRVVWPSQHGLQPANRLAERYETALIFSRGASPIFNKNAIRIAQKWPGKRHFKEGPKKGKLSGHPLGAAPIDVWGDIIHLMHNHPDKSEHPAAFPTAFAKRAILAYSEPGDLICDPFSGSGATEIAAIEAGRAFIGCDAGYEDLRRERVAKARVDTVSWFQGVTPESMALWAEELGVRAIAPDTVSQEEEETAVLSLFDESPAA
jgi:DNA modification methylase